MKSEQPQTKEVEDLKRIVFLIIASLLVIGLVLPSMVSAQAHTIKVIIAGPMAYVQGQDMVRGAQLAASQIGTGINVSGTMYNFTIIQCNTNEISDSAGAGTRLAAALDANTDCKIVLGGFQAEGVNTEIPIVLNRTPLFFIVGAATATLLQYVPYYATCSTYATQKYIFRASPFNSSFLVTACLQMLAMVSDSIRTKMGWPAYNASDDVTPGANKTVRIGIFAESLEWAAPMVAAFQARIPQFGALFGWSLGSVQTVSDTAGSSIVTPALNKLKADECHVILTMMSGDVGTIFSTQRGALGIMAIPVGINVLAQDSDFWTKTGGGCKDEITLAAWVPGVNQTEKTEPFLTAFNATYGRFPIYTAASYDVMYNLKAAIESVGWNDTDDASIQASVGKLIPYFEDLSNNMTGTSGVNAFYPMWDGNTTRYSATYSMTLPALNDTQVDAVYGATGYIPEPFAPSNYTMPSFTSHDLVYGPGYVTGIAIQWQAGEQVPVS
jgi:hypothetical protein